MSTAAAQDAPPARLRPRRPAAVTILVGLQIVSAIGYLISLLFLLGITSSEVGTLQVVSIEAIEGGLIVSVATIAMLTVLTVAGFASSVLLLRMNQLGWTLTMLVTGVSLSSQIYLYVTGEELVPLLMLASVVIVLYLNQRQVRAAFGIGQLADTSAAELEDRA